MKKMVILTVFITLMILVGFFLFTRYQMDKMEISTNKKIEEADKNKKKDTKEKNKKKNMKKKTKNKKKSNNKKKKTDNKKKSNNKKKKIKKKEETNKSYNNTKSETKEKESEEDRYKITLTNVSDDLLAELHLTKEIVLEKSRDYAISQGFLTENTVTFISSEIDKFNNNRIYYYFTMENETGTKREYTIEKYGDEYHTLDGISKNE